MKLNRKGFTLIELLAVVVILALVLILVFPNSIDVFKNAKLKSEEAFLARLSQSIDSYIELNTDTLSFSSNPVPNATKRYANDNYEVFMGTKQIKDVIKDEIISQKDYKNPNNKDTDCNENAEIEIYKDTDSVYCHKVKATKLSCITTEYMDKLKEKQNTNDPYAIDTCIWTASSEEESE